MIIQCEKCQARFRLDDSRVSDKGVKVRCAKCKHVFTVRKEEPETELFEHGVALSAFSSVTDEREALTATSEDQHAATESVPDSSFDSESPENTALRGEALDFSSFESSSLDASAMLFDKDELHIDNTENIPVSSVESASKGGEIDFSDFDFSNIDSETDSSIRSILPDVDFDGRAIEPAPGASQKEFMQGLDFSDDDMFGAVVKATVPEAASGENSSYDPGGDNFAESMAMNSHDSNSKGDASTTSDTPADAPFNMGEIDFGDEFTSSSVQQVNPDDLKSPRENLFAPPAEAQSDSPDNDFNRSFKGEISAGDQSDLPPLSIASRRKQSPVFRAIIAVFAVLTVSVLGYFGYSTFSTQKESVMSENGKIGVRAVKAAFARNDEVGELLVISGEAINEYPKPRAALQVKVTVYDAAGQIIAAKTAYGGNPLTVEQLKSLSLDKIEAAMANQFGDSLANIEVATGKAIPFVVVLANLPKGAKDFMVQSAGSTVAAGKQ